MARDIVGVVAAACPLFVLFWAFPKNPKHQKPDKICIAENAYISTFLQIQPVMHTRTAIRGRLHTFSLAIAHIWEGFPGLPIEPLGCHSEEAAHP